MTAVGDFVLDIDAKRADDTGSALEVGTRGIVVHVAHDRPHPETGELQALLIVATRHHGQLRFVDVPDSHVADSWPCGRIDAGGYISLCKREIARARRGSVEPRVVELLALVTRIKESPASPYIGRDAAHDVTVGRGSATATDGGDLTDALAASTEAHRSRKASA